ncbi:hypothetical protein Trydic_g16360 [Trypoxylus dichotomus]
MPHCGDPQAIEGNYKVDKLAREAARTLFTGREYTRTTGTFGLGGLGCSFSKNGYTCRSLLNTGTRSSTGRGKRETANTQS